ncbi:SET domain-containing protein-lysine N-methyltransferase [Candidatus Parcubacteria bacterium]|nr:SET domain-containing protein-lysine N-methyltransferase [Candidatus Parcubacteria bacterium]
MSEPISRFKLRVGRGISGKGIFAMEEIPKKKRIIEYIGTSVPVEKQETIKGRYLFWTGRKKMIDGNIKANVARFINHSCRPNCEAAGPSGRILIYSKRRIKAGEELTYDYGKEYFDDYIKPIGCRCEKCRSKI